MDLSLDSSNLKKWATGVVRVKESDPGVRLLLWRYRFWSQYGNLPKETESLKRLRLLFGARGSGADWLIRALVQFDKSMPCFDTPSERLDPRLVDDNQRWLLPLGYSKAFQGFHPFEHMLQHLSFPKGRMLKRSLNKHAGDGISQVKRILVHEPNGLLLTEALVRAYRIPMIFMVTDPVYCADRLLAAEAEDETGYLRDEFHQVNTSAFLLRFFKKDARRFRKAHKMISTMGDRQERRRYEVVLTLGALNRMFRYLSAKYQLMHCVSMADFLRDSTLLSRLAGIYCNAPDQKMMANYDYQFSSDILVPDLSRRPRIFDSVDVNQAYRFLSLAGLEEPERLLVVSGSSSSSAVVA